MDIIATNKMKAIEDLKYLERNIRFLTHLHDGLLTEDMAVQYLTYYRKTLPHRGPN